MPAKKEITKLLEKISQLEQENKKLKEKVDIPDYDTILSRRLRIEKAVFDISSFFIGNYILDQSIARSIEMLCQLTRASRGYFYRFHHRAKLFHITHEWLNPDDKVVIKNTPSFSSQELRWLTDQLKTKEIIYINDIQKLPEQATNEKEILTKQGVSSFVVFPIWLKTRLEGFIGLDHAGKNKIWNLEDLEIFKIAADIIGFSIERKQAERSLQKSEEMYQNIFENTGAATITLKADTTIKMVNSEFEKLIGIPRDEIEGKKRLLDLVDKKDHSTLQKYHYLRLSNPAAVPKNYEFNYINNEGASRNAYMTGSTLLNTRTAIMSFIDITEFKQAEKQLRIAKEKAEESDNLKSAFLANVSHEIRTPLNAITGFSALLSNPGIPPDKRDKYIKQILTGSNELVNLIDNVLDISRIESGTLKPKISEFLLYVKLNEIRDFYDDFKMQQGKENLDIKLTHPENSKKIILKTDPLRLQQILSNLIENAIKFTSSGYIEIGYSILPTHIRENQKEIILFFVKDTGIGIAKKDKEKIFERFVKIVDKNDQFYRGAGLGLSLVRDLVHLLKGEVWLESSLGKGSTFYFTIPFTCPKPETTKKITKGDKDKGDFSDKTIIIAEDTESNYLYLKEILSGTGVNIIRAKDGLEAIEIFRQNKNDINLVFMDILMPECDGFEAAHRIRDISKDACIIAQTAFTFEGELENGLYAGCFDDYLLKPFNIKVIRKLLEKYLLKIE